jgi:hypothetical protein
VADRTLGRRQRGAPSGIVLRQRPGERRLRGTFEKLEIVARHEIECEALLSAAPCQPVTHGSGIAAHDPVLRVETDRFLQMVFHPIYVAAAGRDAREVVKRETRNGVTEVQAAPDVMLGLVQPACVVVSPARVDVRRVVAAQTI